MNIIFKFTFIFIFCFNISFIYCEEINKYNAKGQKEGFWIEHINGYGTIESYYIDGKREGVCKDYFKDGKLQFFGEYRNNAPYGKWYFFKNDGTLSLLLDSTTIFKREVILEDKSSILATYKSLCIIYSDTGRIYEEGILLWNDDPRSDENLKYGKWKIYDDKGDLKETKIYK